MTTFNDLTKGVFQNTAFYTASIQNAIAAIKNSDNQHSYYIVFSRIGLSGVEIYLNIKALPNGIAEKGKVYEGKSKKHAIAELLKYL